MRVLAKTGAMVRDRGVMYMSLAQSVILYVSDSWVVVGVMLKVLEGFHHWAARQIMVMMEKCVADSKWEYPLVVVAIEAALLHPIQEYIHRQQVNIAEQVAFRPIYELCIEAERRPGMIQMIRLWYQDVVN